MYAHFERPVFRRSPPGGDRPVRLGGTYYPWGENKGSTNPQNTWGFGTYWQDSASALDYANNRYYSNAYGRFMTPEPYTSSGRVSSPQSWNRYTYTAGDPVNRFDPTGMDYIAPIDPGSCGASADPGFFSCDGNGLRVRTGNCDP